MHLHRINEGKNRWGAPTYELDHSSEGLEVWTADGYCDLTGEVAPLYPVTVLRKPRSEAQVMRLIEMRLTPDLENREVES